MADDNNNKQLLKDEEAFPPKKVRKPAPKRSSIEEEQRRMREKAELLKLRQGVIEESEMIPQDDPQEFAKPTGWKRVENFFYHYKWHTLAAVFAAVVIIIMIVQAVSKEKPDLYVLAISTQNQSGIFTKQKDIETALERYCPDFDGNGYVHVEVNFINLSVETGEWEYYRAQNYRFQAELLTGDSQIYLADTGIMDVVNGIPHTVDTTAESSFESSYESAAEPVIDEGERKEFRDFFIDFTEKFPDAALYEGTGLQLNTTGFKDEARWHSCSDVVGLYVRNEIANMTGNGEDAAEQRRRAVEVFTNIAENRVVNPAG